MRRAHCMIDGALLGIVMAAGLFGVQSSGCIRSECQDTQTCPGSGTTSSGTGGALPDAGTGGDGGGGSTGGGGQGGGGGGACDATPAEDPLVVTDACGVFASPDGDDVDGAGTRQNPVKTLAKAIALANEEGGPRRVYACAGTFAEGVELPEGTSLFGGMSCDGWQWSEEGRTVIEPAAGVLPLKLVGTGSATPSRVENVSARAVDAEDIGASSIAMIAEANVEALVTRCDFVAGDGASGLDTAPPASSAEAGAPGKEGGAGCKAADPVAGGSGGDTTCEGLETSGGTGGTGTTTIEGGPGQDGLPKGQGSAPEDGKGGVWASGNTCEPGHQGAAGLDGQSGAGAIGVGSVSANGYQGLPGQDGKKPGQPGQGGGGGSGASRCDISVAGPGGGGGGAGGCGGAVAKGGGPGGSSIGIISDGASLTLSKVTVKTGKGGTGGQGGDGQEGGAGGPGGAPGKTVDPAPAACPGGTGGKGGRGGSGGGGLGGHSVGIAFNYLAPTLSEDVSVDAGSSGDGGTGGIGADATAGKDGKSCKMLDFVAEDPDKACAKD